MSVFNPFDFFLEPSAEQSPFAYEPWLAKELAPYLEVAARQSEALTKFLATIDRHPRRTIDFLVDLNRRLSKDISYIIRLEPGVQTPEETLALGSGSCRDTGWLLVQMLRHLGLAARFVSGYLIQLTPDVKSLDGPSGPPADFTDLHAWAEVYLPGAGWIGLDPTSGLLAGEGHIPARGDARPLQRCAGDRRSGRVRRRVRPRDERAADLRIAARDASRTPKSSGGRIDSLGRSIDRELADERRAAHDGRRADVRVDRRHGRRRVERRGARSEEARAGRQPDASAADRFAPGGLLHFGQGKWYPGESLPRWALGCWWRRDGEPIWNDDCADRRRDRRLRARRGARRGASSIDSPRSSMWTCSMSSRPTRTSGTTSGGNDGCR